MKPRFLLDEHVNRAIQRQLRRLDPQIQVLAIGDQSAPPIGTTDPDILDWLENNGYILVTENRSTMPIHLSNHLKAGRHIHGVFWIRPGVGLRRIVEELYLIWLASELEEYQDCTLFIPSPLRTRAYRDAPAKPKTDNSSIATKLPSASKSTIQTSDSSSVRLLGASDKRMYAASASASYSIFILTYGSETRALMIRMQSFWSV